MSRFIYGTELNNEISNLIKDAILDLIFVSPFIKLHPRLKDELKAKENKENLHVSIVFGKNADNAAKSFSLEELNFFKQFPNLEIRFEPRLHAKYYANDNSSILTSMNLYDFSINNNIEFGVLSEPNLIGSNKLDIEAIEYFKKVIDNAELVYKQEAVIEKTLGGLRKTFKGINVIENNIQNYYNKSRTNKKDISVPPENGSSPKGYCIRSGVEIEFNAKMPFTEKAYQSWSKFGNEDYPEKYCHFSGELSNGETSFSRPILKKNWKTASTYMRSKGPNSGKSKERM